MSISFKDLLIQSRTGIEKPILFLSTSFVNSQQEMAETHFVFASLIALNPLGEKEALSSTLAQIHT